MIGLPDWPALWTYAWDEVYINPLTCLQLYLMPSFLLRHCRAGLVRESEGSWHFRRPGLCGSLLDLLQEVLGCHLLRMGYVVCSCCWKSFQAEMRKQENRQWDRTGVTQTGKWKASRRSRMPGPSCLTYRSQLCKRAVAGVDPNTFLQPVRSSHVVKCFTWEVWMRLGSS